MGAITVLNGSDHRERYTSRAAGAASIGQLCTYYVCEFDQLQIGRNRSHQLPTLAPINKWKEGAKNCVGGISAVTRKDR